MSIDQYIRKKHDYIMKIVMIGDTGVGKTNILFRFSHHQFHELYTATIGLDFKIKNVTIDEKNIRLQIWDTAGQQRFKTITETYYKGALGIVLVYSITNYRSFESISKYLENNFRKMDETNKLKSFTACPENTNSKQIRFIE